MTKNTQVSWEEGVRLAFDAEVKNILKSKGSELKKGITGINEIFIPGDRLLTAISQAQQEAYEEGVGDGWAERDNLLFPPNKVHQQLITDAVGKLGNLPFQGNYRAIDYDHVIQILEDLR